ncbi:phasin family protein [Bradyrhizobium sp. Pha-3]|uniref:phasin family protein n=1 Tax=Bradyrhizobium sp. Pha-3 TaxID=208375 RepID=UPI0035D51EC9
MTTTHKDKPRGKPRQRSRKADQRNQKPDDQQQSPKLAQRDEDRIGAMVASIDTVTNGATAPAEPPSSGAPAPADAPLIGEVAPTSAVTPGDNWPVSIQTIANAYRDYTKRSLEETGLFVEKLMAARSFDKANEVQTEFARQAYANFVAESQKICELYSELAKQIIFRPWEGFAAKVTQTER